MKRVYLDNNATTAVDPRVLDAMLPFLRERFGNPSSRLHEEGHAAAAAVERARAQVAAVIGAEPREIVFTGGATEANNIALKGVAEAYADRGGHMITQLTEHKSVLQPCAWLERRGLRVTYLPVDAFGRVDPQQVADALQDDTILVSIMHGNNEIGTLQPVAEIGRLCRARGVLFHTDCAQTFGRVPLDVNAAAIDLLTCSAHKKHGPKGIGALYIRRGNPRVRCEPVIHGSGQEDGLRSGTLNVPGIVGLAAAATLCHEHMAEESAHLVGLRERLKRRIVGELDGAYVNGHETERIPTNMSISFEGIDGEALMTNVPEVSASSASACASGDDPSHVLRAIGRSDELAGGTLRLSVGRFNTIEEIDFAADLIVAGVRKLRALAAAARPAG